MQKITSKTGLGIIKQAIYDDFNVHITDDDAREIRDSRRQNTSTWNEQRYINCAHDARITRIETGRIQERSGAWYTSKEWNS